MEGMTVSSYAVPVFARLTASAGRYLLPSGRRATIVGATQLQDGEPVVTLRYDDDGDEITISKAWLNQHGRPA